MFSNKSKITNTQTCNYDTLTWYYLTSFLAQRYGGRKLLGKSAILYESRHKKDAPVQFAAKRTCRGG